jgi:protease-4
MRNVLKWLKKAALFWVVCVGAFVTISFFIGLVFNFKPSIPTLPKTAILKLDLAGDLYEKDNVDLLGSLRSGPKKMLYDTCDLIKEAAKEDKIQGIFVRLLPLNTSFAQIQELQNAFLEFKKTGKKLYLYANFFNSSKEYYLASVFDEIYMLPLGHVGIAGLHFSTPFIRELLDKWEITPHAIQAGKYKAAPETFTHKDFSKEHKESLLSILSSIEDTLINDIGKSGKIENVRSLFEQGNVQATQALNAKLITQLGHYQFFEDQILKKHDKDTKFYPAKDYDAILDARPEPKDIKKHVALLVLSGSIHDDQNTSQSPLQDQNTIRPSSVAKQLKALMKDEKTVAVVLRIDSPGGSATASEDIWGQIMEFKKTKPVIASMGSVAASGGYYIASACNKIVAQPLTITGSIGAFSGKLNVSKFFENLGIHFGSIYSMESATLNSFNNDYSPAQKEKMQKDIEYIYDFFKNRVAQGRNLSMDQVEDIAQGRIWTGAQAKERNLVDELGGIDKAFDLAKQELKLEKNEKIDLYVYTPKIKIIDLLMGVLGFDNDSMDGDFSLISYFKGYFHSIFFKTLQFDVQG